MAEDNSQSRRVLGGSAVFRAASHIDERRDDVRFADAVILARLVLELSGGPAPLKGKRAICDLHAARRLTKLGLTQMEEGFGSEVGTRGRAGFQLRSTPMGENLVSRSLQEVDSMIADRADDAPAPSRTEPPASAGLSAEWVSAARYVLATDEDPEPADDRVAAIAHAWMDLEFKPAQVRPWRDALVNFENHDELHTEAARWRSAGFDPAEASIWHYEQWVWHEAPDVEFATLCREKGWSARDVAFAYLLSAGHDDWSTAARRWVEMSLPRTLDYVRAGLTPDHAKRLHDADLHDQTLEAELRLRYAERVPIDPYLGMHFNHRVFIAFGEDVARSMPFWAERVPDLHDDEQAPVPEVARLLPAEASSECPGSGGRGRLEFRDGWEEWYVHCAVCEATWIGGSADDLPSHTPR